MREKRNTRSSRSEKNSDTEINDNGFNLEESFSDDSFGETTSTRKGSKQSTENTGRVIYTWDSQYKEYEQRIETQCKLLCSLLSSLQFDDEKDIKAKMYIMNHITDGTYLTSQALSFLKYIYENPDCLVSKDQDSSNSPTSTQTSQSKSSVTKKRVSKPRKANKKKRYNDDEQEDIDVEDDEDDTMSSVQQESIAVESQQSESLSLPPSVPETTVNTLSPSDSHLSQDDINATPVVKKPDTPDFLSISSLIHPAPMDKGEVETLYINTDSIYEYIHSNGTEQLLISFTSCVTSLSLYRARFYSFRSLTRKLVKNIDPFLHTQWHQYPYTARPFFALTQYEPCEGLNDANLQNIKEKMISKQTTKCENCCCSSKLPVFNSMTGVFESECPCMAHGCTCGPECECMKNAENSQCLSNKNIFKTVEFTKDIAIKDSWGIDSYTRCSIQIVLTLLGWDKEMISTFIVNHLLPSINIQGQYTAFDMRNALFSILQNETYKEGVLALIQFYLDLGPGYLRVHPKGKGAICCNPNGIPANTIISPYLGELYPPWKWFEKQEGIKKALKEYHLDEVLPDFYNILLEKNKDSDTGYDCIYIDPIFKGNYSSRLSHSCEPNCATTSITIDGKVHIVLTSIRPIHQNEELCFDYSCVSESHKEFKKAICLCGQPSCRGSYVSYADGRAFNQAINPFLHFLRRTRVIYEACTQSLTTQDIIKLSQAGIKSSVLFGCPSWLTKYAALNIDFIQFEKQVLPQLLMKEHFVVPYTKQSAELEANGIYLSRLQNLVTSIDKVKHYLSLQPAVTSTQAPFDSLSEEEVTNFLWNDDNSVMNRLFSAFFQYSEHHTTSNDEFNQIYNLFTENKDIKVKTSDEARERLTKIRDFFWSINSPLSGKHKAAGDALTFYIHTHIFFRPNDYNTIGHQAAYTRGCDLPCSAEMLIKTVNRFGEKEIEGKNIRQHVRELLNQIEEERKTKLNLKSEGTHSDIKTSINMKNTSKDASTTMDTSIFDNTSHTLHPGYDINTCFVTCQQKTVYEELWDRMTDPEKLYYSGFNVYTHQKSYNVSYVWGQLTNWFKQTIDNPSASLSAERRGCLSLPDIECVYTGSFAYNQEIRKSFFLSLLEMPTNMWKLKYKWAFRNSSHIYGTPMFDCVLGYNDHFRSLVDDIHKDINIPLPKSSKKSMRRIMPNYLELLAVQYPEWPSVE